MIQPEVTLELQCAILCDRGRAKHWPAQSLPCLEARNHTVEDSKPVFKDFIWKLKCLALTS